MTNLKKNTLNGQRPVFGQIVITAPEPDFSTCPPKIASILHSSIPELKEVANSLFFLDTDFQGLIINTFLFELKFLPPNQSVIIQVRAPLSMPKTARTTPRIKNAKETFFRYREDQDLVFKDINSLKTDRPLEPPLLVEDFANELEIPANVVTSFLKQTPRIRLLLLALSSGIITSYDPNTFHYSKAVHDPTLIIVDFVYLYTQDILAAFLPHTSGEEKIPTDHVFIKVKKDIYNECMVAQPEKFALF